MTDNVNTLISDLRCDVSLPEKKLQSYIEGFVSLTEGIQQYTMTKIKAFLLSKNLLDAPETVALINDLQIPDLTRDVKTPANNIAFLSGKAGCAVPEPLEIVLGKQKHTKRVLTVRTRGKKFQRRIRRRDYVSKIKIVKHAFHYIPISETLRFIMSNPKARAMVNEESKFIEDGTYETYQQGSKFKNHPFLQLYPTCVRLSLHIDEGEYCNALGSRRGNNKLTNICFKIENFDAKINSSLDRVYLALTVKSKVLKKYG